MHTDPCVVDYFRKTADVGKISLKYYVSFHMIPMLLRLRKCKDRKGLFLIIQKTVVEYIRSVLFMAFLVSGVKAGLCTSINLRVPFEGSYRSI